jgi:hypothetical protein
VLFAFGIGPIVEASFFLLARSPLAQPGYIALPYSESVAMQDE